MCPLSQFNLWCLGENGPIQVMPRLHHLDGTTGEVSKVQVLVIDVFAIAELDVTPGRGRAQGQLATDGLELTSVVGILLDGCNR